MNKVNELNMYSKLLEQPLFQGMSKNDLQQIIMHTKFGFHQYHDGEIIANEGDKCTQLKFLTNGCIQTSTSADDRGYTFQEKLTAPDILQPERIFGLTQQHTKKYTSIGKTNLITLNKEEIIRLSDIFPIFRINLINIITTQSQRTATLTWQGLPANLRQRIIRFFEAHCDKNTGEKHIYLKMTRLASELNDNRLNISIELNKMQSDGLIILHRGLIYIPAFERLL